MLFGGFYPFFLFPGTGELRLRDSGKERERPREVTDLLRDAQQYMG